MLELADHVGFAHGRAHDHRGALALEQLARDTRVLHGLARGRQRERGAAPGTASFGGGQEVPRVEAAHFAGDRSLEAFGVEAND
jgi:hypothetical protein